ncbi:hypothetical protein AC249_AIPGENE14142 [Exaiptasia diaphana]|nr:hypothetical protein AC249_AIPGENE14142 [Exaiptasia diaphana]
MAAVTYSENEELISTYYALYQIQHSDQHTMLCIKYSILISSRTNVYSILSYSWMDTNKTIRSLGFFGLRVDVVPSTSWSNS